MFSGYFLFSFSAEIMTALLLISKSEIMNKIGQNKKLFLLMKKGLSSSLHNVVGDLQLKAPKKLSVLMTFNDFIGFCKINIP